ncbi:MAG: MFS transporter, partial [Pseudomonadota bacterium]
MADQALNPDEAPDWRGFLAGGRGLRLSGLLAVVVLHAGGNYAVVTLAPAIVADLGGGALIGALTALFNITTVLAAAAVGPLAGRFGPGPLLWAMTVACLLGALLSAGATSMTVVALGRALAGFGGGGLLALAYVAMRAETTAAAFPKLSALTGAFWIGAAFAGPLLGGLLADLIGWRPAFLLIGGLSLAYAVANRRTIAGTLVERLSEPFPAMAFATFGVGVALISFAPLFGTGAGLAMAAAGLGSLLGAALRERRRA